MISLEPPPHQLTHLGDSCRVVGWWINVVDRIHYRHSARAKLGGRISDRFAKTFIGRSGIQLSGHTNDCDHGLTDTLIDHGDMIAHHTLDRHASDPDRAAVQMRGHGVQRGWVVDASGLGLAQCVIPLNEPLTVPALFAQRV